MTSLYYAPDTRPFPKTLSQSIYNHIKESIIKNRLKAKQKINEKTIAQVFNVSTTPVREAVLKLGAEGFIHLNSHRDAVVRETSFEELKCIFQTLGALEALAAASVIDNISSERLTDMATLLKKMEHSGSNKSPEKQIKLNGLFHQNAWESLTNRVLQNALMTLYNQLLRYNHAMIHAFRKPGVMELSVHEHREILKAIQGRDKHALKDIIEKHWNALHISSPLEQGLINYFQTQSGK